jgi:anti-sigma B factor antagonist
MHRISLEQESGAAVVVAAGELDAFVERDLVRVFTDTAQEDRVVVDLSAVSFLDSTALGVLVRAVRELDGRGGAIRVVLPEGSARRIFEITTLDRVLPVSSSRRQAFADLDGAGPS